MKPHPTKSKPRKAVKNTPFCHLCGGTGYCEIDCLPSSKPSPRQPDKGGSRPDGTVSTLINFPSSLNPYTRKLVKGFAQALAQKLAKAEEKYGYSDGWMETAWIDSGECARKLLEHAKKGDPRDVAAYCAFLWYHEASTNPDASLGDTPAGEWRGK